MNMRSISTIVVISLLAFCVSSCVHVDNPVTWHIMGITIQADGIDKQTVTVPMGGTLQLRPVFKPDYATVIDPVWQSDDETIATVSSTGMVTGVKTGTTSITVFSEYNPEARDQITINVEGAIISIDKALVDQSEAD